MTPYQVLMRLRQIEDLALNALTAHSEMPEDWLTADRLVADASGEISTQTYNPEKQVE